MKKFPIKNHPAIPASAQFGAVRKHDIHTGIDLHCDAGAEVFAIEDGLVVAVASFTGPSAGSPWWADTDYIGINGSSGYIVYGEVSSLVSVGDKILAGQLIGHVKQVLKKDKGQPMSMLHLELYSEVVTEPVIWNLNEKKPNLLEDPLPLIEEQRFNHDCETHDEASRYLRNREKQLRHQNIRLQTIKPHPHGTIGIWEKGLNKYISFFIFPEFRSQGLYKEVITGQHLPVLTVNDCDIVNYLQRNKIPHEVMGEFLDTVEYKLISKFYGDKKAKRSQAFLMNHIDEGLEVLSKIGASQDAMRAFCIHPILQSDEDLKENFDWISKTEITPRVLMLALEYRNIANSYLSTRKIEDLRDIHLSPIKDVNDMLIADKVQNYKDFILYHKGTHPRSTELIFYFENWFNRLEINRQLLIGLLEEERIISNKLLD